MLWILFHERLSGSVEAAAFPKDQILDLHCLQRLLVQLYKIFLGYVFSLADKIKLILSFCLVKGLAQNLRQIGALSHFREDWVWNRGLDGLCQGVTFVFLKVDRCILPVLCVANLSLFTSGA